ncbi:molybdate ABC transporter permease subunit [Alloacidobacterium dinghuense]|uniref:Molybdenum transport system permease n=1 Tax=Alloacidobacterium dinghuense TaxID=2763107 RepID=A0A7G8BP31_9BACT|nr:molybdate ABC transporter permease subunit [Alloacidobacterium dinghuense]QNI34301.1 molybdate ABC transporter permease subunit [Alloacidobacterium dinghuense]
MDLQALWLTLKLASVTTLLLLCASIPLSYWLVFGKTRWKSIVEAVATLPLLLPPTVLGFYLLVLLGPRTLPGRFLIHLIGHPIAFSFSGLVIGSMIYSLPFAVQPITSGFSTIATEILDAAILLGANRLTILTSLVLPLAQRSIFTAAVLCFTHTIGEFGVVLMIGGDIPGATRTLSIAMYDQVQDFRYSQANHTALLLLAISLGALILVYGWRKQLRRV